LAQSNSEIRFMAAKAHIAHHIPGRLRLRIPAARDNPRLLRDIKEFVAPIAGVRQVDTNPRTGSVLVHYDPRQLRRAAEDLAQRPGAEDLFSLALPEVEDSEQLALEILRHAEFFSQHSETAHSIVRALRRFNQQVRHATDNAVDLKVLLPMLVATYTVLFEVRKRAPSPRWLTLLVFAFDSFVRLHQLQPGAEHSVVFDSPEEAVAVLSQLPSAKVTVRRENA
jgi:hypothetical protein